MTKGRSRDIIVREGDFLPLLQEASKAFGGWAVAVSSDQTALESPLVVEQLVETAHALETFVDDYGARDNRTFVTFGELVASIRGLAAVSATALHLRSRIPRYQVVVDTGPLEQELRECHEALRATIQALAGAVVEEAGRFQCNWKASAVPTTGDPVQRRLLPRSLDEAETVDERQHIAEIGAKYLKVLQGARGLNLKHVRPREDLAEFVAKHASEARCRYYEAAVHSIQSMYDTYVLRTPAEKEHPWLETLRGHASVTFHLLEMATGLVHFYERHEGDIRHEPARKAIAEVVSEREILHLAVNCCLRQAYLYVEAASGVAERLLRAFVPHGEVDLPLPGGVTLHARPLALIVQVARYYGTPIEIRVGEDRASANSLMGLIMLGGKHPQPESIHAEGDSRALRDLQVLFDSGLGENGSELPESLSYLRYGA